jgi:cytochrome c oxidase subunit IV
MKEWIIVVFISRLPRMIEYILEQGYVRWNLP